MELLNRVALVIRPKRRYAEWARSVATGDDDPVFDLDEARLTPSIYLVAARDGDDLEDLIDDYAAEMFEAELEAWHGDEAAWPVNRSPHVFRDWFDVTLGPFVQDLDPDEPLEIDLDATELDRAELLDALAGDPDAELHCAWCETVIDADAPVSIAFLTGPRTPHETPEAIELAVGGRVVRAVVPSDDSEAAARDVVAMIVCCGDDCRAAFEDAWSREHTEH
jgi:hypothetical protein